MEIYFLSDIFLFEILFNILFEIILHKQYITLSFTRNILMLKNYHFILVFCVYLLIRKY